MQAFYSLHSKRSSLLIDCRSSTPVVLYWGARLAGSTTPEIHALLATRQEAPASAANEAPLSLSSQLGAGFLDSGGIHMHRDGRQWGLYSVLEAVEEGEANSLTFVARCESTEVRVTHTLQLHEQSDVLCATTRLENLAAEPLWVERCDAPSLPLPQHCDQILGFEGRWAGEFQMRRIPRFLGIYLRENRSGRTSHDSFPGVIVHTPHAGENAGEAYGLHLGWSGNHRVSVEEMPSGLVCAQLGELFYPGEISLAFGESYESPTLYGAYSSVGLTGLTQCFHHYVRDELSDARVAGKARPVHFNSWEALYFDISEEKLFELAEAAAAVGVERFVVDDGWFRNRNSDSAGLGDWFVDESVFPQGLAPLSKHVEALGMELGLWIEPEMVNPDSDLYRAHPDWVLQADPAPRVLARNQLVLDLTRTEVVEYLFERIDALLGSCNISYLKWDMNRALHQPGGSNGRAVTHRQTLALYALLQRVRTAHPTIEIESCASGGGRADFGILAHTDRIWTSDSNDALDRLRIQKGFSHFFPAEVMGAHVGPATCHSTGRQLSMATRAAVALFGHMGVEANLLEMDDAERRELSAAITLHKQHRRLVFSGDLVRLDTADYENAFGVVAGDRHEALFSYALLEGQPRGAPGRLRFAGLSSDSHYTVNVVWPENPASSSPSIFDALQGATLSGDALMRAGMQLPLLQPHAVLIFHLRGD